MKTFLTPVRTVAIFTLALTSSFAQSQSAASSAVNPNTPLSVTANKPVPADVDLQSLMIRPLGLAGKPSPDPVGFQWPSSDLRGVLTLPSPGFYPADVDNPANNPSVVSTLHHPIYVDMPPSHWGDVATFIDDLGKSEMIEVVDQYVGVSGGHRYKLGGGFQTQGFLGSNTNVSVNDIVNLVYSASLKGGNNFGHIYHVFLPKGIDTCLDKANTICYSPDNPNTFYFCGYHSSISLTSGANILFSVEPYQDVIGCSVPPTGTANNQLVDSTNTVLSHEIFESISDPLGISWWVHSGTVVGGDEIGDLCIRSIQLSDKNYYWNYPKVKLNNHWYTIQPEYSDVFHGCVYSDFDRP